MAYVRHPSQDALTPQKPSKDIADTGSCTLPTPFCHLHMHTSYSLLDGTNQLDPLLSEIQALRQPAVAMTDHGNLFGAIQFYSKAKALGVNPIIGCEAYMAPGSRLVKDKTLANNDYYHLILLAQNEIGYRNLIKLVSRSYLDGFSYKPRMDKDLLRQHHEGLIALSGCLTGEIPSLIGQGDLRGATAAAREFQDIFGPDRFYLEIQANGLDQQRTVNRGLIDLHKALGIPIVGTNDCHYLRKADAYPHDLMLCVQTGTTVRDPHRVRFHTDQLYVKSSEEMAATFCEIPEAISNTNRIAEQCALELTLNTTYLPNMRSRRRTRATAIWNPWPWRDSRADCANGHQRARAPSTTCACGKNC